jgi:hypothetical protein
MRNGSHHPRQLPLPPPDRHVHDVVHPVVEALKRGADRLRSRADQALAAGHWDVAAWLEEQAALAEHRAGLVGEEPLALLWRN